MTSPPCFSIVIPVFNRCVAVRRAIDSCLAQDFAAFEVVVVDDGSSDRTAESVAEYADPRVRLIVHEMNQGANPARSTAIRASLGEWVIYLDSDDEMLPGCLSCIHQHAATAGDTVDRFGFQFLYDDGRVTPSPLPPEPIVGYAEWLRWIEHASLTDSLWVTRRRCFGPCPLPEGFALEFSYSLDFAKRFKSRLAPIALGLVHTDSADRLSYMIPPADPELVKRTARDQAANWQYVLAEHGAALRKLAPRHHRGVLRNAAVSNLLAGNLGRAVQNSLAGLRLRPMSLYAWATVMLVLGGPWLALIFTRMRAERRRRGKRGSGVAHRPNGPFAIAGRT